MLLEMEVLVLDFFFSPFSYMCMVVCTFHFWADDYLISKFTFLFSDRCFILLVVVEVLICELVFNFSSIFAILRL